MAEVTLQNISKIYEDVDKERGRKKAVNDISFTVKDKEFMVLVGPSGCGKSTLLRMIAGLEDISEGTLAIDGKRINDLSPKDRDIAMVFQNYALYPHMTVYDNMAFGLRIKNFSKSEIKERVMQTAQLLEIEDELFRKPKTLSGGQRQRAFLARALINNPKLLVLDEPTSGVDIKTQHDVLHLLGDINSEGITILLTTHDLNAVASHLPWVICFNNRVVAQGKPRDIFTNEILTKTYGGDIIIVEYEGHFLIANSTPLHLKHNDGAEPT